MAAEGVDKSRRVRQNKKIKNPGLLFVVRKKEIVRKHCGHCKRSFKRVSRPAVPLSGLITLAFLSKEPL
jgi:hypothetical protein